MVLSLGYLSKKDDVVVSGLATSSCNEFVEVIIGGSIAIPATVAFFGIAGTQQIAAGGAFDLGFLTMPLIVQKFPLGQLFGTVWFLLLFLAGITSSVAMTQPLMAFLQEEFNIARKKAALIIGVALFFLTQPVIFFLKYGFLDEMDFWIGTIGLVVFAIIEVILFVWILGPRNAWKEISMGADLRLPRFFYPVIRYITPAYLFVLFGFWLFQEGLGVLLMSGVPEQNYPYIWFARFLLTGLVITVMILVGIAWQKRHVIQRRVPQ